MRLGWPVWGGRAAHRSRPRVAQAIQAARAAHSATAGQPQLAAWVSSVWAETPAIAGAFISERAQLRPAGAGLSPDLVRATARAARASGRPTAEVWSEALRDWLASRGASGDEYGDRPALSLLNPRRAQAWQAIEATMGELRAS
ncbi:MAG TPA: hypothetical protein VF916_08710 [Ktedonobacterales bacterium]